MSQIDAAQEKAVSPYTLTATTDIAEILRSMAREKPPVRLRIPPDATLVVTALLQVDTQGHNQALMFAYPGDTLAHAAVRAPKIVFETSVDQVHVHFSVPSASISTLKECRTLRTPWPERIFKLQRRLAFRVKTPVMRPTSCLIHLPQGPAAILALDDISEGGIGLYDTDGRLSKTTGTLYENCTLALPQIGTVAVKLRIVHTSEIRLANEKRLHRIGFSYVDCDAQTLEMIRSYVVHCQREAAAVPRD